MKYLLALLLTLFSTACFAACPVGATCTQYDGTVPYAVTGGSTARTPATRAVDNWKTVTDLGVDCTGATDVGATLQAAVSAMGSAGSELRFPAGCTMKLGTGLANVTINAVSYNSGTGATTLTLAGTPAGISVGSMFNVTGITGISGGTINGIQIATAGTTGTTINYTASTGLTGTPSNSGTMQNCGIGVSRLTNVQFVSEITTWQNSVGNAPSFKWYGNGGQAFCIYSTYHPTFIGLGFILNSGAMLDGCLDFDGEIGPTPTGANVQWVSCQMGLQANPNFVGFAIAPTSTSNHEFYYFAHNYVLCSNTNAVRRATDGVLNGTTALTSATANFVGGDVSKRVRISFSTGLVDTTIASVTNSTTVVLATPTTGISQTGATIHTGQAYGTGILNGSVQARGQTFENNFMQQCSRGFDNEGGAFTWRSGGAGLSDVAYYLGNAGDTSEIAFDQTEGSLQLLSVANVSGSVVFRSNRIDVTAGLAYGLLNFAGGGRIAIDYNRLSGGSLPANSSLMSFGNVPTTPVMTAKLNNWDALTPTQVNYTSIPNLYAISDNYNSGQRTFKRGLPTSCSGQLSGTEVTLSGVLNVCP